MTSKTQAEATTEGAEAVAFKTSPSTRRVGKESTGLLIGEGEAAGLRQHSELLETHLVDEGVQRRDGTAQIGDTPIKGLDLLLQLRNALAIGDHGSLLLTTFLASANSRDFCTLSADTA